MDLIIHIRALCPLIRGPWPTSYVGLSPLILVQLMVNDTWSIHSHTTLVEPNLWWMTLGATHSCTLVQPNSWRVTLGPSTWSSSTRGEWQLVRFFRAVVQVWTYQCGSLRWHEITYGSSKMNFATMRRCISVKCKVHLKHPCTQALAHAHGHMHVRVRKVFNTLLHRSSQERVCVSLSK